MNELLHSALWRGWPAVRRDWETLSTFAGPANAAAADIPDPGFDVLEINDPLTDPAKSVTFDVLNVQTQQQYDEG